MVDVVVGGGHNGLVAACYLARAGRDVVVLEALPEAGDIALDQLGFFRPTPTLNSHRTPIDGLYVSGAGTSPTGGMAGTPDRQAARAVLADRPRR